MVLSSVSCLVLKINAAARVALVFGGFRSVIVSLSSFIYTQDSTRSLYEKKIREAMAKGKRAPPTKPDKTYYREEGKVV